MADPVHKKKRSGTNRNQAKIYKITGDAGDDLYGTQTQPSRGKTGVEYCFYKMKDFKELNQAHIDELTEWHIYKGVPARSIKLLLRLPIK